MEDIGRAIGCLLGGLIVLAAAGIASAVALAALIVAGVL